MLSNLLDQLFQRMPMGVALFDTELYLQRCNPTWVSYFAAHNTHLGEDVGMGVHLFTLLPGNEASLNPYVTDVLNGETIAEELLRLTLNGDVVYWDVAFVPVIVAEKVTGFLQIATDVTERVLSRQLLERRVHDRTRKLSALYNVMSVAADPLPLTEILQESLRRILTAVRANAGTIQLLDVSGEWLQLVVWQGFTEDMVTKIEKMPADAGLSGWAFTQDEPLILDDVNADWRTSPVIRQSALTVYAGVPMNVKGKIVGVLNAFREKRTPFHAEDIALLTSVADQVGISVENARLRTAKDQLIAAEERNQLARDLHDSVTQSLYSLTLFAEVGRRTAEGGDLRQTNIYLKRIGETAQQTLKEMRLLVYKLRPPILVEQGLIKALQHRLNGVEGRAGISTRLIAPDELILPDDVAETLFFIAQEALNNALKHAAASTVVVKLEADLVQVVLTVSDNGNGFDYESVETGGMGLTSMRERAELNAGNFQINSVLGKGTTVTVILPHERV